MHMKYLNKIIICLLLSNIFLTGCYPGNEKVSDIQATEPLNSNIFEITNSKLHSSITEDDLNAANTITAKTGIIGKAHSWNADTVDALFGATKENIASAHTELYSEDNIGY